MPKHAFNFDELGEGGGRPQTNDFETVFYFANTGTRNRKENKQTIRHKLAAMCLRF
jgi:hypothetical protein